MTGTRATLAVVLGAVFLPASAGAVGIQNLGLAADEIVAGSKMFAFVVDELKNGGQDLNGDGDAADVVVHVYDREREETINLGLSAKRLRVDGEILAFVVAETSEGADLNGDGDTLDVVPHVFDRRDQSVTNLGRHSGVEYVANRRLVAFIDNGFAGPLWVYDTTRRQLSELGFPGARFYKATGGNLVFEVDGWVYVHRLARDRTVETGLRVDDGAVRWVTTRPGRIAIPVSETRMGGMDYNGDGDTLDRVVHLFQPSTGGSVNSGVALGEWFGAAPVSGVRDRFLLWVSERSEGGRDLNGDGDAEDVVLHRLLPDGAVTNLALAGPSLIHNLGTLAAFYVTEPWQDADLNGDGDAEDSVAYVYDATWDEVVNTGLARVSPISPRLAIWRRGVVVPVGEHDQGGVDLNGDGDVVDTVPQIVEVGINGLPPRYTRVTNTRLALGSSGFYIIRSGRFLVMSVSELGQGGTDLDGDGQLDSSVPHSFRVSGRSLRNWMLNDYLSRPVVGSGGAAAILAWEWNGDLNGDGDAFDQVVHVGSVWPRR